MRILRLLVVIVLSWAATGASASQLALQMQDFALPGRHSEVRYLGGCNSTGTFEFPMQDCEYLVAPFTDVLSSSDETLAIDVTPSALPGVQAQGYDRYVSFREAGNSAGPDDIVRVQWSPQLNSLFITLVSGSLVPDYVAQQLGASTLVGEFENEVNEEFFFGFNLQYGALHAFRYAGNSFGFETAEGPLFEDLGAYAVVLGIVPTAMPLPGTLALAALGLLGVLRARTGWRADRPAADH